MIPDIGRQSKPESVLDCEQILMNRINLLMKG
ncbi:MAG: hypothetical protein RL220_1483 [Bacteroidota bacterium]